MEYYGTLGPACCQAETLRRMIQAGMTGIRLNLSHKSLKESEEGIQYYLNAAKKEGVVPHLMIDLQGPELRIGNLPAEMILEKGRKVTIGDGQIPISKKMLPEMEAGQQILLDDGKIKLEVLEKSTENQYSCQIVCGGILTSKKSVAFPGCQIHQPTLTTQDIENLSYVKEYCVTDVMLPFVRDKKDLENLRSALHDAGCHKVRIFAKIENMQGVKHVEKLIPCCDYIVIARGDLGNAMPLSKLPGIQYQLAKICRKHKRKFLVVTQMLNSMMDAPYPTRAEVNDIFQAVMQGASAIMLTGETAAGKYPVEAMKMLTETGEEARKYRENI